MAFCSGSYLARPNEFLILDLEVFFGTGTLMTTWVANNFSEKLAITFRLMEHLFSRGEINGKAGEPQNKNEKRAPLLQLNLLGLPLLLDCRNQPKR